MQFIIKHVGFLKWAFVWNRFAVANLVFTTPCNCESLLIPLDEKIIISNKQTTKTQTNKLVDKQSPRHQVENNQRTLFQFSLLWSNFHPFGPGCPNLEFHLREGIAIIILQRPLPLENLKVNGKLLKGHQGQDQGQWRPWPACNFRPVYWKVLQKVFYMNICWSTSSFFVLQIRKLRDRYYSRCLNKTCKFYFVKETNGLNRVLESQNQITFCHLPCK